MIDFEERELANGLTVLLAPMKMESVTVLGMVRAGSADEVGGEYGGAHFLEHMVFKGTRKFPRVGDIAKAVESVGGEQNAFTSGEHTGFWVKTPAGSKKVALEVVGQMMGEAILPEEEFKKEKGTIIEEIRLYDDWHPRVAEEKFEELVFKGTGLERPIAGSVESIKEMKIKSLRSFYDCWYQARNMVVVVVGRLGDKEKLIEKIEEEFRAIIEKGEWEDRRVKERRKAMRDDRVGVVRKEAGQTNLVMGVNWFQTCNRRRSAALVMNKILGKGMISRLWREIREKRGLAYFVNSEVDLGKNQGAVYVQAAVRQGKEEEVVGIVREEMRTMVEKGINEEELERAKKAIGGAMKLSLESSSNVANTLAKDWVLRQGKVRRFEDRLKEIEAVTREKVLEVAKEMLGKDRWCLSVVGDFDEKEKETELRKVLKS